MDKKYILVVQYPTSVHFGVVKPVMNTQCGICKQPATNRKYRKLLHGESAREYVRILVSYTTEHFQGSDLEGCLKELPPNKVYICRKCQELASKYEKLHTELHKVSNQIDTLLSEVLEVQHTTFSNVAGTSTQVTPTRPRSTTKESPAVAVSYCS